MCSTILSKSTDDICIHKHHKPISFMMVVNQWIYPSRCTTIIVIFHDQTSFINAMLLVELLLCIESFSLMAIIERPDHLNTQMCVCKQVGFTPRLLPPLCLVVCLCRLVTSQHHILKGQCRDCNLILMCLTRRRLCSLFFILVASCARLVYLPKVNFFYLS